MREVTQRAVHALKPCLARAATSATVLSSAALSSFIN